MFRTKSTQNKWEVTVAGHRPWGKAMTQIYLFSTLYKLTVAGLDQHAYQVTSKFEIVLSILEAKLRIRIHRLGYKVNNVNLLQFTSHNRSVLKVLNPSSFRKI